jgi:hypothetical protein
MSPKNVDVKFSLFLFTIFEIFLPGLFRPLGKSESSGSNRSLLIPEELVAGTVCFLRPWNIVFL